MANKTSDQFIFNRAAFDWDVDYDDDGFCLRYRREGERDNQINNKLMCNCNLFEFNVSFEEYQNRNGNKQFIDFKMRMKIIEQHYKEIQLLIENWRNGCLKNVASSTIHFRYDTLIDIHLRFF